MEASSQAACGACVGKDDGTEMMRIIKDSSPPPRRLPYRRTRLAGVELGAGQCVLEAICGSPGRARTKLLSGRIVLSRQEPVSVRYTSGMVLLDCVKAISTALSATFSVLCIITRC